MTTPIRSTIFPGSRMTDPIRYIRFHTDRHDCECCGRVIVKGTLELSDGRRYGPQCAARAMGRAKLTGKEARRVAADYRFERHALLTRACVEELCPSAGERRQTIFTARDDFR